MTEPMTLERLAHEHTILQRIVRDTLWMACRYAHGRQSYSVGMYNSAARQAVELGFLRESPEPVFAIDGSLTREMSGLSQEEFDAAWAGWSSAETITNHCNWSRPKSEDQA